MASRPTLEEINDDDIDNMDMDIAQFDPSLRTPLAPVQKPVITRSQDQEINTPGSQNFADLSQRPASASTAGKKNDIVDPSKFSDEEKGEFRQLQVIYPCYFDVNRSHGEGRRVSVELAVSNPLAKTISDACRLLGVPVLLELDKSHPQDFGNPGRVKVQLKKEGKAINSMYPTKRSLMLAISKFLQAHPTTIASISKESGIPYPKEYEMDFTPEELPRVKGFKMNTIVPVHSNLTLKHPMMKLIYDPEPEPVEAPKPVKAPKKKMMKIRG
ncbi:SRP19-domain-containing protein [Metschnikowia bicuspidata var. bicuspidata NRRL YB-4993]|uniref:Signal recognition particle SEC65 subunit n=1 Tax=Metschnikowia bicuspidata var. bicuspidata NRRL YB-4993 TaxID=869754 RepID=A0A1A0H6M8_9ASCO|nr:SRP19-domain-containing protein [Metschnikowia bicuspidata var. bicuspidata NRRL YB-4993]OBA19744.1 SRP19-domain-containing protein [Metschnikowia bicuspidata var. bicuspidata NRRL YB-4993]